MVGGGGDGGGFRLMTLRVTMDLGQGFGYDFIHILECHLSSPYFGALFCLELLF